MLAEVLHFPSPCGTWPPKTALDGFQPKPCRTVRESSLFRQQDRSARMQVCISILPSDSHSMPAHLLYMGISSETKCWTTRPECSSCPYTDLPVEDVTIYGRTSIQQVGLLDVAFTYRSRLLLHDVVRPFRHPSVLPSTIASDPLL
jgi:hypothetical protein